MDAIASATRRIDSSLHAVGAPPIEAARTLSVTADYRLSEAGRKASLLAGGDGRVEQRVKIAVPTTRLHLVHVDGNGVARLKLRPQFKLNPDQRIVKIKLAPVYDYPPPSTSCSRMRRAITNSSARTTRNGRRARRLNAKRTMSGATKSRSIS